MINLRYILSTMLVALALGCNPTTVPQAPAVDKTNVETMKSEGSLQNFEWTYYKKHDPAYLKALELIKADNGASGKIDAYASGNMGHWYFIILKEEAQDDPLVHDASTTGLEPDNAYLVDMQNQKKVAREDWNTLANLANDLQLFATTSDKRQMRLAKHLALATSIIAFENANYLSIIAGQKLDSGITDPHLSFTTTQAKLVYFICGAGMGQSTTRCELNIDKTGKANFEHAPFEPDIEVK